MKSNERDKKEKVELKLYFYKEDQLKVLAYWSNIQKYVSRGDKVPARLLKKWFAFFDKPNLDEEQSTQLLIDNAKSAVEPLLIPKYDFEIKVIRGQVKDLYIADWIRFEANKGPIITVSLREFLTIFFDNLGKDKSFANIVSSKHKFIEKSYGQLRSYLKIVPQKKQPKLYTQTVIIGYLAACFDLVLDEKTYKKSPSFSRSYSEYLHFQTLHTCKKVNTKGLK